MIPDDEADTTLAEFIRWCDTIPHPGAGEKARRWRDASPQVRAAFRRRWREEDAEISGTPAGQ